MFDRWGNVVHRFRYTVLGIVVVALLGLAGFGLSLNDHLSQSGWDDPNSASVIGAKLADETFGRDTNSDVLAMYTAPAGTTIQDPAFRAQVQASLDSLAQDHPDQIDKINGSFLTSAGLAAGDGTVGVASIAIKGDDDTARANNYRDVQDAFYVDGMDVQLAGLLPITGALNDTMAQDIKRMEVLAFPAVGILLFFVFGGAVAAALPLIVGGLTVFGANGVVRLITEFTDVNNFVASVVSLIGFGLAIDYGLFMVSRFREELADGRSVGEAVRRTVATAGRTVVFSATIIIASLGGLILFPQGFLKSVAYGSIATVGLAAFTSITVLPAILGILGKRVDALSFNAIRQNKTSEQIESGFWGRLTRWVMKHPVKVTIPVVVGLLLLTLPAGNIAFGGINEDYLPPNNTTREAQEHFDDLFPGLRTEPLKLVVQNAQGPQIGTLMGEASNAPGLVETFSIENIDNTAGVAVLKAGLIDRNDYDSTINYLRSMAVPDGVNVYVAGTPAIEYDSIAALLDRLPLMLTLIVVITTLLMFLTFGSLVLPIKAILATALSLGATMGILTWIFVDGHGADLLNFTPGGIMAPVLVLIVAIIFGLSTDYEIFLVSRIVEARAHGASTAEAVRIGTAHTGRIITAAALILIVVTGAFAFSDLVMMKYISYGMIAALIIDATVIRMLFVPATMKLLGDDCWWAPAWLKRLQERTGLAEPIADADAIPSDVPRLEPVGVIPMMEGVEPGEPMTVPIPRIEPRGMPSRRTRRHVEDGAPAVAHQRPAELDVFDGGPPTEAAPGGALRPIARRGAARPQNEPRTPQPADQQPADARPGDGRTANGRPADSEPEWSNGVAGGARGARFTDAQGDPYGRPRRDERSARTYSEHTNGYPDAGYPANGYDDSAGYANGSASHHPDEPVAPRSSADGRHPPRGGDPAQQRPIESWLAELRASEASGNASRPAPVERSGAVDRSGTAGQPGRAGQRRDGRAGQRYDNGAGQRYDNGAGQRQDDGAGQRRDEIVPGYGDPRYPVRAQGPEHTEIPAEHKPSGSRADDDYRSGGEYASSDPLFDRAGAERGGRHGRDHGEQRDDADSYPHLPPGTQYPGEDEYMTPETDSADRRRVASHRAPTGALPVVPVPADSGYGGRRHRRSIEDSPAARPEAESTPSTSNPAARGYSSAGSRRADTAGAYDNGNGAPTGPRNGNDRGENGHGGNGAAYNSYDNGAYANGRRDDMGDTATADGDQDRVDDSNGRHAANTGAITVSELLARQRRD